MPCCVAEEPNRHVKLEQQVGRASWNTQHVAHGVVGVMPCIAEEFTRPNMTQQSDATSLAASQSMCEAW
eukprot:3410758-Pyramimonas_sp.AAC.2